MKKLLLLALLFCAPAWAQMCKYAAPDGQVVYANVPIQDARKVECYGQEEDVKDKKTRERKPSSTTNAATPANFPRVDSATQQQRDDTRRRILADELANERNALEVARKDGKISEITLHQKNVQMLEKELSGTK